MHLLFRVLISVPSALNIKIVQKKKKKTQQQQQITGQSQGHQFDYS
jgi:hypothetical protein